MAKASKVIIGIDEAGTGSWAGGFTVAAYASLSSDNDLLKIAGARDSKSVSATYREMHLDPLKKVALAHRVVFSPHLFSDIVQTWNMAVMSALWGILGELEAKPGDVKLIIDGVGNKHIRQVLQNEGWSFNFLPKADVNVPVVGAASILAKTTRSSFMKEIDKEYPEYNWKRNDGYGTEEHMRAIFIHGITKYHRLNRTLEVMRSECGVRG